MSERKLRDEAADDAVLKALDLLSEDESYRLRQHLAGGCPVCMDEIDGAEETAADLALLADARMPSPKLWDRLMDRISTPQERPGGLEVVHPHDAEWTAARVPGVYYKPLRGKDTMLVRLDPGAVYPGHVHNAAEQCLVLGGSVTSQGVTVHAGDFTYMPAGSTHSELTSDTGCLLLIFYS